MQIDSDRVQCLSREQLLDLNLADCSVCSPGYKDADDDMTNGGELKINCDGVEACRDTVANAVEPLLLELL